MRSSDGNRPEDFQRFIGAPRHRLFAVIDEREAVEAAIAALGPAASDGEAGLWVLHGEEGIRRLDFSGRGHGLRSMTVRLVQRAMSSDFHYLRSLDRALRDGRFVLSVALPDREAAERTKQALRGCTAHSFAFVMHMNFVSI